MIGKDVGVKVGKASATMRYSKDPIKYPHKTMTFSNSQLESTFVLRPLTRGALLGIEPGEDWSGRVNGAATAPCLAPSAAISCLNAAIPARRPVLVCIFELLPVMISANPEGNGSMSAIEGECDGDGKFTLRGSIRINKGLLSFMRGEHSDKSVAVSCARR
jgi:hypothetical protein